MWRFVLEMMLQMQFYAIIIHILWSLGWCCVGDADSAVKHTRTVLQLKTKIKRFFSPFRNRGRVWMASVIPFICLYDAPEKTFST
jgi:hypothetical protein